MLLKTEVPMAWVSVLATRMWFASDLFGVTGLNFRLMCACCCT